MQLSDKCTWACIILFPVLLLLIFANVLLFDIPTYRSLLEPDAVNATVSLLQYFDSVRPLPGLFDSREAAHLVDVKYVVNGVQLLLLVIFIVFLWLFQYAQMEQVFTRGALLLLAAAFLLWMLPFDALFTKFHEALFAPGTWVFPQESALIRMYPFAFFQAFFAKIVLHAALVGSIFGLWGLVRQKPR